MNVLLLVFAFCILWKCSCFSPIVGKSQSTIHMDRFHSSRKTELHESTPSSSSIIPFLNSQKFTYVAGGLGLTTVLLNRLAILDSSVSDFQSRLDLISTMAASALLLNALTQQEIETRERDSVTLVGYSCTSTLVNTNVDASSSQSKSKSRLPSILINCSH